MDFLHSVGESTINLADMIGELLYNPVVGIALVSSLTPNFAQTDSLIPAPFVQTKEITTSNNVGKLEVIPDGILKINFTKFTPLQKRVMRMAARQEKIHGLPEYSLRVLLVIESRAGLLNVCNKYGYCGAAQAGKAAWREMGFNGKSRLDLKHAVRFAAKYAKHNGGGSGFALYGKHQQGKSGFKSAMYVKYIGGDLPKRTIKTLVRNQCNNLPKYTQSVMCKKQGKFWVPAENVTYKDINNQWIVSWQKEVRRIEYGLKHIAKL